MSVIRTALHPSGRDLVFDTAFHSYKFLGKRMFSVSKVLDRFFPFDTERVVAMVARKENKTPEQVLHAWSQATVLGSNVHAHIESLLLNEPRKPITDLQGEEQDYYPAATIAANSISEHYDTIACEAMVCSPKMRIAGTIDFLGRNKKTGAIAVMDWKTTSGTLSGFRFGSMDEPCPAPLGHLPNSKITRYSLQVMLYGHILKSEGYSKIYGKELDTVDLEYGIVQIGKSEGSLMAEVQFYRVVDELLVPPDDIGEYTATSMLLRALKN
jgi:hypothetical protein